MPDQSDPNTPHLFAAHAHILDHTPVKHTRWYVSPTTSLMQVIEMLQDNAFTGGETISNIRGIIIKIVGT
jgi:hypothetical protein